MNELLCRRVDIEDVVSAHRLAIGHAQCVSFDRFIISAPTPFLPEDLPALSCDAPDVVRRRVPEYAALYSRLGWSMSPAIDRVYDSGRALDLLGWKPRHDFRLALEQLEHTGRFGSDLARAVGIKGYHETGFTEGPYPVADGEHQR